MKLLSGSTSSTIIQLFRYFWVGGFAFVVDYITLFVLTEYCNIAYLYSAAIAFVFGLAVNYLLSTVWVFNIHRLSSRWSEFTLFSIIGLIGLCINELIMYVGSEKLKLHYMLTKLFSTAIVFFWNFFSRKLILFNK